MKQFVIALIMLLVGVNLTLSNNDVSEYEYINCNTALNIVKSLFTEMDADYYINNNSDSDEWDFFVDVDPFSGWEHECYRVSVPKHVFGNIADVKPKKELHSLPPIGDYTHIELSSRHAYKEDVYKEIEDDAVSRFDAGGLGDADVANRTYVVIISGGINVYANYERYWNDCSYLYRVLRNRYAIPKSNIYPLMADGNDPELDTNCFSYGYKSQSLDLDNDGEDEIELAATKSNVVSVLSMLEGKLHKDDHLFLFVIDHGGRYENGKGSLICLWNDEQLKDVELVELLRPFSESMVNVNVVLGQCFSGGFVEPLSQINCVVSTACAADETSKSASSCGDQYDEFVYRWICGINGQKNIKLNKSADEDNNGRITMEEAFNFARLSDTKPETPQFSSTPMSIGQDLSFNYIPKSIDLYIKDGKDDSGKEPYTSWFWKSPSIKRFEEADDGIFNNSMVTDESEKCVVVTVHNRGKEDYIKGKSLYLYWSEAAVDFTFNDWTGKSNDRIASGLIGIQEIGDIESCSSKDYRFEWPILNTDNRNRDKNCGYCFLAIIKDNKNDNLSLKYKDRLDIAGHNDMAQSSVLSVFQEDAYKWNEIKIRNINKERALIRLGVIPTDQASTRILKEGGIELGFDKILYDALKRGGLTSDILGSYDDSSDIVYTRLPHTIFENILMEGCESGSLYFRIKESAVRKDDQYYAFDFIQKDDLDKIIGGMTYRFIMKKGAQGIDIISSKISTDMYKLEVENLGYVEYEWKTANNVIVGTESAILVSPDSEDQEYYVKATCEDGTIATGSILLQRNVRIKSVLSDCNNVEIILNEYAKPNSRVEIRSALDYSLVRRIGFPCDADKLLISQTGMKSGAYYIISYFENDVIRDSLKFSIP